MTPFWNAVVTAGVAVLILPVYAAILLVVLLPVGMTGPDAAPYAIAFMCVAGGASARSFLEDGWSTLLGAGIGLIGAVMIVWEVLL